MDVGFYEAVICWRTKVMMLGDANYLIVSLFTLIDETILMMEGRLGSNSGVM